MAITGEMAVNQPGKDLLQGIIIQPQLLQGFYTDIGDEHVRLLQQLQQNVFTLWGFQVQGNELFPVVLDGEYSVAEVIDAQAYVQT